MGFTEVLTIVFIVLKLCKVIAWSWWLVLLPEIIAIGFYIIILAIRIIAELTANRRIRKMYEKGNDNENCKIKR